MKALTFPQQSKLSSGQGVYKYSFPQVQYMSTFSKRLLPTSKTPKLHPCVWSFAKSNPGVSVEFGTREQQESHWEEITSTFLSTEVQIRNILSLYTPIHLKDVKEFLTKNEFLIPLLFATYLNIMKIFSCSDVTLDVLTDYEYSHHQELVAHVVTSLPLEEAFQQLKQFDEQWWLSVLDQAQLKFDVNLEFE